MPTKSKLLKKTPRKRSATVAPTRSTRPPAAISLRLSREDWLLRASELLLPFVRQAAAWGGVPTTLTVPPQVSCSWPPGRNTTQLSTSTKHLSAGHWEITLSPALGHSGAKDDPGIDLLVLSHLTHELVHCICGDAEAHRGAFAEVAATVGLQPPLSEPSFSSDLAEQVLAQVLARIGRYPHLALAPPARRAGQNRQKKWICEHCGKIVRCAGDLSALHLCEDGQQGRFILAEKS